MTTETKTKEYTLDATGKKLGRFATEIAVLLLDKANPNRQANQVADMVVKIENADKLDIPAKKLKEKVYLRYSGYPGGQKSETLEELIEKKGHGEVIKRAVWGMLPINKLRSRRMKNIIITN